MFDNILILFKYLKNNALRYCVTMKKSCAIKIYFDI